MIYKTSKIYLFLTLLLVGSGVVRAQESGSSQTQNAVSAKTQMKGLHAGFNIGPMFITAKNSGSSGTSEYEIIRQLKTGYNFQFNGDYVFSSGFGLGMVYQRFRSSANTNVGSVPFDGRSYSAEGMGNISLDFIGPQLSYQVYLSSQRYYLKMAYAIGAQYLKETLSVGFPEVDVKAGSLSASSSSFAASGSFSFGLRLVKQLYLDFTLNSTTGNFRKFNVSGAGLSANETQTLDKPESRNRVGLNLGVHYHF